MKTLNSCLLAAISVVVGCYNDNTELDSRIKSLEAEVKQLKEDLKETTHTAHFAFEIAANLQSVAVNGYRAKGTDWSKHPHRFNYDPYENPKERHLKELLEGGEKLRKTLNSSKLLKKYNKDKEEL